MAEIKKINSLEEYDEFVSTPNSLNVIKIGAVWCGPCRMLERTIRELTPNEVEGVLLAEVDADEEWFEDKAVEMSIRGIPVLIAYKGGEEKERLVGAIQKPGLLDFFGRNK